MNKEFIVIIALVICVVVTYFYQKKVQNDLLNQLYELKKNKDEKGFIDLLNSAYCKFVFSKFTLEFMKLNYYLDEKQYQKAKSLLKNFNGMNLKYKDMIALNLRMFNSAIEAKDYALASNLKEILLKALNKKADENSKVIAGEIIQIDKIYIQKDVTLLDDLLEALDQCEEDSIKSLLSFRIAKLYHYMNQEDKVDQYLKNALAYSNNAGEKQSLQALMKDHSGLD